MALLPKTIAQLPALSGPLSGTAEMPISQGGTRKVAVQALVDLATTAATAGAAGSATAAQTAAAQAAASAVQAQSAGAVEPVARPDDGAPVAGRNEAGNNGLSSGTYATITYRFAFRVMRASHSLRFGLPAAYLETNGQTPLPNPYTAKMRLEVGSRLLTVTWGGQPSVTVTNRERMSDVVPVMLAPGWYMGRIEASVTEVGMRWPTGYGAQAALGEGFYLSNRIDTPTAELPAAAIGALFSPAVIVARGSTGPTVAIMGSSSFSGQGDTAEAPNYERGYTARALAAINVPYVRMSSPGDSLLSFLENSSYRRSILTLTGASHVVLGLGSNDILAGRPLETIMSRLTEALDIAGGMGLRVLLPTYTPRNESTDGWTTLAGQTVGGSDGVRQAVNSAIRGGLGHPAIAAVLDIAGYFEAAGAPGKWRVDLGGPLTADGTHNSQLGHRLGGQFLAPVIQTALA